MIRVEDLMIGDWVLLYDKPRKVEVIYDYGRVQVGCIEEDCTALSSIPLTPEILEKNGFHYNDLPFVQSWEQFGLALYLGGDGYRINCGQNVAMVIDSVHQLQHAFRLCEIDKEIVI